MTHADSFVSLREMVNDYLDSLGRNLRCPEEGGDLAKAGRERRGEDSGGEPAEPPETWE